MVYKKNLYGLNGGESNFDPWGVRLNGTGVVNGFQNRWELQGHEKEMTFNLNRVNFGARVYNPTIGRFDKPDRYSEKYMPLSTYQYAANDPIRYVDINGDSLWITHKGNNYLYNDGQLFNSDGSQFEGKMKGFLKQTFNALNKINKVSEGKEVLGDLSTSTNNFYISHASNNPKSAGANQFIDFNRNASYANAMREENQGRPIPGGSGGTVYWNPNEGGVTELGGSIGVRPISNLGHELFHAFDANHGNSDNRASHIQLNRGEVRAAYFENQLRKAFAYPYRESYNTSQFGPVRILDSKNQPINFPK